MAHKDLEFWQMTALITDIDAYVNYLNELPLAKNKKRNHLIAWGNAHKQQPQDNHLNALTQEVTP
jgi:hypothetical protein